MRNTKKFVSLLMFFVYGISIFIGNTAFGSSESVPRSPEEVEDVSPPYLLSLFIDNIVQGEQVKATPSQPVTFSGEAADDASGIDSFQLHFLDQNSQSKIVDLSFDSLSSKYQGQFQPNFPDSNGEYLLEKITISDFSGKETVIMNEVLENLGNYQTMNMDHMKYWVEGVVDQSNMPRFQQSLLAEPITAGQSAELIIQPENHVTRYSSLSVQYVLENSDPNYAQTVVYNYDSVEDQYKGMLQTNFDWSSGKYDVFRIDYTSDDTQGVVYNAKYAPEGAVSDVFETSIFTVRDKVLLTVTSGQNYYPNTDLSIEAICLLPELTVSGIQIEYINEKGYSLYMNGNVNEEGRISLSKHIHPYVSPGTYKINAVYLYSSSGQSIVINNTKGYRTVSSQLQDLSSSNITVSYTMEDISPPVFESINIDQGDLTYTDPAEVTVLAQDATSGITQMYAEFQHDNNSTIHITFVQENGVWKGRYPYDPTRAEGIYKLAYLQIVDGAENYITLYNPELYEDNPWVLKEESFRDKAIAVHKPQLSPSFLEDLRILKVGDSLILRANILNNELFQIDEIEVFYQSDQNEMAFSVSLHQQGIGHFYGARKITPYHQDGTFSVEKVILRKYGTEFAVYWNLTDVLETEREYRDFSSESFTVVDTIPDSTAPTLETLELLNGNGSMNDPIRLQAIANDDVSGVNQITARYEHIQGNGTFTVEFVESEGIWYGEYLAGMFDAEGPYSLRYVNIADAAGNEMTIFNNQHPNYQGEETSLNFQGLDALISGTAGNYNPEILLSISGGDDNRQYTIGDQVRLLLELSYEALPIDRIHIYYNNNLIEDAGFGVTLYKNSDGVFETSWDIHPFYPQGSYRISEVALYSDERRVGSFWNNYGTIPDEGLKDFTAGDFSVSGTQYGLMPELTVTSTRSLYRPKDFMNLSLRFTDASVRPDQVYGSLVCSSEGKLWSQQLSFYLDEESGLYKYMSEVSLEWMPGTYRLENLWMNYGAHRIDLSSVDNVFDVTGTLGGYQPSIHIQVQNQDARAGETVEVFFDVDDTVIPFTGGKIFYKVATEAQPHGKSFSAVIRKNAAGHFSARIPISQYMDSGGYIVDEVHMYSRIYNVMISDVRSQIESNYRDDFSQGDFSVSGTTSDITSPQFVGLRLSEPYYVGEDIEFEVLVDEFESGFQEGSVTFSNQGYEIFAHLREASGKIYGRISNTRDYPAGNYVLDRVRLMDHASNNSLYVNTLKYPDWNWANPLPEIILHLEEDTFELSSVTISEKKDSYKPGDSIQTVINATLPLGRIDEVQLEYLDPNGTPYFAYGRATDFNEILCQQYIPANIEPGEYQLESIWILVNSKAYRVRHSFTNHPEGYADLSQGNFHVSDTTPDQVGPSLLEISINSNSFKPGDQIQFALDAIDLGNSGVGVGIQGAAILLRHMESGRDVHIDAYPFLNSYLKGVYEVPDTMPDGQWIVEQVLLYDEGNNMSVYYNNLLADIYWNSFDFTSVEFEVYGTFADTEPPVYYGSSLTATPETSLDPFEISLDLSDLDSEVSFFEIIYTTDESGDYFYSGTPDMNGNYKVTGRTLGVHAEHFSAMQIIIRDRYGNVRSITDPRMMYTYGDYEEQEADLSHLDFSVIPVETQDISGFISNVSLTNSNIAPFGEKLGIQLNPGYLALDAEAVLFEYAKGVLGETFELRAEKNIDNEGIAYYYTEFDETNVNFQEDTTYTLLSMRLLSPEGENRIFSVNYPDLEGINMIGDFDQLNFSVQKSKPSKPKLSSFQVLAPEFVEVDGKVIFAATFPMDSTPVSRYEVYYRINGRPQTVPFRIDDVDCQQIYISKYSKNGMYTVDKIRLVTEDEQYIDYYNRYWYPYESDRVEVLGSFSVITAQSDSTAPAFTDIQTSLSTAEAGDVQEITITALDSESGLDYAKVIVRNPLGAALGGKPIYLYPDSSVSQNLKGAVAIDQSMVSGIYSIETVQIYDRAGNVTFIENISTASQIIGGVSYRDLAYSNFEILNTIVDLQAPSFTGFTFENSLNEYANVHPIRIQGEDTGSGLKLIRLTYKVDNKEVVLESPITMVEGVPYATLKFDRAYSGKWSLRNIEVYDQVNNRIKIFHSSVGSLNTMDLSFGDYTPIAVPTPLLTSITADRSQAAVGETITITGEIQAVKGLQINALEATLQSMDSPGDLKRIKLTPQSTDSFMGNMIISPYEVDGEWRLLRMAAIDRFENSYALNIIDDQYFKYTVLSEEPDYYAPELEDISLEQIEEINPLQKPLIQYHKQNRVTMDESTSFSPNDIIRFIIRATDDRSGVERVQFVYSVYEQTIVIDQKLLATENGYYGEFKIQPYHPSGEWKLQKIVLYDSAQRFTEVTIDPSTGTVPGYSKLNFSVTGTTVDKTNPTIGTVSANVSRLVSEQGDFIEYTVEASDNIAIDHIELSVRASKYGTTRLIQLQKDPSGVYKGQLVITKDMPGDLWKIERVSARDKNGNVAILTNKAMGSSVLGTSKDLAAADVLLVKEKSLSISTLPKQYYRKGEVLDLNALKLQLTYTDGTVLDFTPSTDKITVQGFDSTQTGNQNVTIIYNELEVQFTVNVSDRFAARSLSLEGKVEINFYMKLTEDDLSRNPELVFTSENHGPVRKSLSSAVLKSFNGTPHYVFTFDRFAAKEMADTVTATLYLDGQPVETTEYSVLTYAKRALGDANVSENLKNVVKSMLNYGSAAQQYFGYKTDQLANSIPEMNDLDRLIPFENTSFDGFINKTEAGGSLTATFATSLILQSDTVLRMYVTTNTNLVEGYKVKYNIAGSTTYGYLTFTKSGENQYYADITGIAAKHLNKVYEAVILDSEGNEVSGVRTYSPFGYGRSVVSSGTASEVLKNLMKSMSDYQKKAAVYFGS